VNCWGCLGLAGLWAFMSAWQISQMLGAALDHRDGVSAGIYALFAFMASFVCRFFWRLAQGGHEDVDAA
jgi:hypothetical protein